MQTAEPAPQWAPLAVSKLPGESSFLCHRPASSGATVPSRAHPTPWVWGAEDRTGLVQGRRGSSLG